MDYPYRFFFRVWAPDMDRPVLQGTYFTEEAMDARIACLPVRPRQVISRYCFPATGGVAHEI